MNTPTRGRSYGGALGGPGEENTGQLEVDFSLCGALGMKLVPESKHHPRLRFVSAHRVRSHRDQSRGSFDTAEAAHFGAESNENLHG